MTWTMLEFFFENSSMVPVSKVEKDHIKNHHLALPFAPSSQKNYRSKLNLFFELCEDEG